MNPDQELQSNEVNDTPDIEPIEIPGRNMHPSIEDRVAEIESVLNL